jgi:hypothetical protein
MPLKYACFISYRRYEDNELADALVTGLYKSLKNELDPLVGPNRVYRDETGGMAPGSLLVPNLSRDICESACMVVVYGPDYFSRDNPWCAREFKAMLDLEQARLQRLAAEQRLNGFLVIIVFRGPDSLPKAFLTNRVVSRFDKYALFQPEITKHPDLYPEVMKIAAFVAERFNTLRALGDPCADCPAYQMPSVDEALAWLDQLSAASGATIQQEPADAFPR